MGQMDFLHFPLCLAFNDTTCKANSTLNYVSLTAAVEITLMVMQLSQHKTVYTSISSSTIYPLNSKGTLKKHSILQSLKNMYIDM